MKNLFFVFLTLYVSSTTFACIIWTPGFIVQIQNLIPNSTIQVHCKSKDDDIGDKWLKYNEEFHFKFCENELQGTLFFCHWYWDSKEQVFDVFNNTMLFICNIEYGDNNPCNWAAKNDGLYFYDFTKKVWGKQYEWKPRSI